MVWFDPDAQGVPDIFIEGLIKEDMFDYLKLRHQKVEEYFSVLDDGYKAAVQKINGAKAKVRSIDELKKKKKFREREIMLKVPRNAENRVRQLQNNANGAGI